MEKQSYIIEYEIEQSTQFTFEGIIQTTFKGIDIVLDKKFKPIIKKQQDKSNIVTFVANLEPNLVDSIKKMPNVKGVWKNARIEHFIDCDTSTANGNLSDVAETIGASAIWAEMYKGLGVVVGICDSGVDASVFPVTGGWSPDSDLPFGEIGSETHGNMCANAVIGMAPEASIYDIGVLKTDSTLANAIAGYDWAISEFKSFKKPNILSNSWGFYQESWDEDYATNPMHPFTQRVIEAIDAGIIVIFAAGNCGSQCADQRCDSDTGPGNSIWGANGHEKVICVGAVNLTGEWIGYSSEGPASLFDKKPDLCGISHFKGYYDVDTGTSAATPVVAGATALLINAFPSLKQDEVRSILNNTAKDLGGSGWDSRFGYGMIQAYDAYGFLTILANEPLLVSI